MQSKSTTTTILLFLFYIDDYSARLNNVKEISEISATFQTNLSNISLLPSHAKPVWITLKEL